MRIPGGTAKRVCGPVCALALLALLIAGCGDDEDSGSEPSEPTAAETTASDESGGEDEAVFETDPCTLLAGADVRALLGKQVEGELQVEGDAATLQPGQCLWETGEPIDLTDPNSAPFSVSVSAGDRTWYDNNVSLVEGDESYEELDGIADAAFAGDTRGGFLSGSAGITVELGIANDPASHEVVLDALDRVAANYKP